MTSVAKVGGTGYLGVRATRPPQLIVWDADPTIANINFVVGTFWLNKVSRNLFRLAGFNFTTQLEADWVLVGGATGDVSSLTGNDGNPATPLLGNINIRGDGGIINITRSPDNNSLLVQAQGNVATVYQADSGSATPTLNTLNVLGGTGITTSAVGNSVVITSSVTSGITALQGEDASPTTGSLITLGTANAGSSVRFNLSAPSTLSLRFTRSTNTLIGQSAGNGSLSGTNLTGLGINVLNSATTADSNVAIGSSTMTAATTASDNTAIGVGTATTLTTGGGNTLLGNGVANGLTTGDFNVAVGLGALATLSSGIRNSALGFGAGGSLATNDSDNVCINSTGVAGDNNTLRIGRATGTNTQQLNRAFIHGIRGITTGVNDAIPVLIDSAGQLGTVSSSARYKTDIEDLASYSDKLQQLRPVSFRYKKHASEGKSVGLIAEEVHAIMPELVIYAEDGQPETVRYHDLAIYLLQEVQRQAKRIDELEKKITT